MFLNDTATAELYPLSLRDALPISDGVRYERIARLHGRDVLARTVVQTCIRYAEEQRCRFCTIEEPLRAGADRKGTRLNSSHANIPYAALCLGKKRRQRAGLASKPG